jgi:hypothetical protein
LAALTTSIPLSHLKEALSYEEREKEVSFG